MASTIRISNSGSILLFIILTLTTTTLISCHPSESSMSIHDLLRSKGLPAGLIPKEANSYTLDPDGRLEVLLDGPCLTEYESRVYFDRVVRANLTYGGLTGVVGLSQEELFLWLPVKDITVDDPNSGLILFDIGFAHKQLSISLFEDPPSCKSRTPGISSYTMGKEKNDEFDQVQR